MDKLHSKLLLLFLGLIALLVTSFALRHTPTSALASQVVNPNGAISPTLDQFDPTAIYGFDTLRLIQDLTPILGPNWSDVMTYCDYQWMSKTTYMKLKEAFSIYLPIPSKPDQDSVLSPLVS